MRGFNNLPMWGRLTVGLSVAAAMFIMIWWMQGEESKREAKMMGICWDVSGQAHYPEKWDRDSKDCADPQPLNWKKSPKLVYWDFDKEFDGYLESHRLALEFVNDNLEQVHLIETNSMAAADIIITHGSANEGTGAMATRHNKINGRIVATIIVKKPQDTRQWMLEEEHELLHCLGLAHDRSGIMNPQLKEGEHQQVWHLHKVDRDAILSSLRPKEQPGASDL